MNPAILAVAAGVSARLNHASSRAVDDAYGALTAHLVARFPRVDLGPLLAAPASSDRQVSLAAELALAGADRDPELSQLAWALVATLARDVPQAAVDVGIDLRELKGQFLNIQLVGAHAARTPDALPDR